MTEFVFLAIGFKRRRAGFLGLTKETDFCVLGIFSESSLAVKAIETRLGEQIHWAVKKTDVLTAKNPLNNGWFEVRRQFLNVPNFALESGKE